ncbi:MAG TPA: LLM class flavin-dependent oxidoreductase [bacterium]|nr:LLM class flavin-dependent oxidoreductase [bacterium]
MAPVEPLKKVVSVARLAEELGFEHFVHADQRFSGEKDVFVTLAADALSTTTIKLGPCVSDPYCRIPAMLATAVASLDELSGGRALLALGAGGSGFAEMHLERKHVNEALRETITMVRGLFSGEAVNFDGRLFKLTNARLRFEVRPDIPILIASRSPLNLELAGEIADGAIIATYVSKAQLAFAIERVRAGAWKARRRLEDVRLISWVYTSISDDGRQAVENVRPFVTQALVNTSPEAYPAILEGFDEALPPFLVQCRERGRAGLEAAYRDRRYLTDEVIKRFSVAGTAEDCIKKIEEIRSFGIDEIWLRCFSAPRSEVEHEKVIVPFAEKVMPRFR